MTVVCLCALFTFVLRMLHLLLFEKQFSLGFCFCCVFVGFVDVFGVHIHKRRGGNIGLRASEAETTLAVLLVDNRQGSATAHYGRHFFGIEGFRNSQVFDGQHDDSPKGLVWVGW